MLDDPTILMQAAALIASLATAIATFVAWRFFNIKLDEKHTKSFSEGVYNAVRWLIARYGHADAASKVNEGIGYVRYGKPDAFAYFQNRGEEPALMAEKRITALLDEAVKYETQKENTK